MKRMPGAKMFKSIVAGSKGDNQAPVAAALMPVDFFEVKKIPRGNYRTMSLLTIAVLVTTLFAFLFLSYEGSKATTTVSEVKTEDLTGIDGWESCIMISKANVAYALGANATFTLVNVMESKAECTSNLATAAPCASGSIHFEATSDPSDGLLEQYAVKGAIVFGPDGNLWGLSTADDTESLSISSWHPKLYSFSSSTGEITLEYTSSASVITLNKYGFIPGRWAINNSTGTVYALHTFGSVGINIFNPSTGTEQVVDLSATSYFQAALAIDTFGGVWFLGQSDSSYYMSGSYAEGALFKYDPETSTVTTAIDLGSDYRINEESASGMKFGPTVTCGASIILLTRIMEGHSCHVCGNTT